MTLNAKRAKSAIKFVEEDALGYAKYDVLDQL